MALWFAGAGEDRGRIHQTTEDLARARKHVRLDNVVAQKASCAGNMETATRYAPAGRRRYDNEPTSILYNPENRDLTTDHSIGRRHCLPTPRQEKERHRATTPRRLAPFASEGNDAPVHPLRSQRRHVKRDDPEIVDDLDLQAKRRARTPPTGVRTVNQESTVEAPYLYHDCRPGHKRHVELVYQGTGKQKVDFQEKVEAWRSQIEEAQRLKVIERCKAEQDRLDAIKATARTYRTPAKGRCHTPPARGTTPYATNLPMPYEDSIGRRTVGFNGKADAAAKPAWRR